MNIFRSVIGCFVFFFALSANTQWEVVAPNLLNTKDFNASGGTMTYSAGKVWAALTDKIWMSSDDGATWNDRTPPFAFGVPREINFFDANNGLFANDWGVCLTRDGGLTWSYINTLSMGSCNDAKFIASPQEIVVVSGGGQVAITRDAGASWIYYAAIAPYYPICAQTTRTGLIHTLVLNNAGSRILSSYDYGATWTYCPKEFDWDCYSFAIDPCDPKRFYVVNEEIHALSDYKRTLIVSNDLGTTWNTTYTYPNDRFFCGSVTTTRTSVVFAQTLTNGLLRSSDQGATWQNIGGPNGFEDSRMIACKDENTIFSIDTNGTIWRTTNSGGFPLSVPRKGTLTITPSDQLFFGSRVALCDSLRLKISLKSTYCLAPYITSSDVTGNGAADYSIILAADDSIIIQFKPLATGVRFSYLSLTVSAGTTRSINLRGQGIPAATTVAAEPMTLFIGDSVLTCKSRDRGVALNATGCTLPSVISQTISGAAMSDYTLLTPGSLQLIGSDTLGVRFAPSATGRRSAMLEITISDGKKLFVPLEGNGVDPGIGLRSSTATLFDGDSIHLCDSITRTFHIISGSCASPNVISQSITGIAQSDYALRIQAPAQLTGDDSVTITFSPSALGLRQAFYDIALADNSTLKIPLMGTGSDPGYQLFAIKDDPFAIDSCALCNSITMKFRVHSSGCVVPRVATQNISGASLNNYSITSGVPNPLTGDDTVTITFTPSATGKAPADYTLIMADGKQLVVPLSAQGFRIPYTVGISMNPFDTDSLFLCQSITRSGIIKMSGCPLPYVASENILGASASEYTLISQAPDSIANQYTFDITFSPTIEGDHTAKYKLTFDDGNWIAFSLYGYGRKSMPLLLSTNAAITADTLGGGVTLPITVTGLDVPRTVEMKITWEKDLEYLGTSTLAGMQLDIAGTKTQSSTRIRIPRTEINLTGASAYAKFALFADSIAPSHVFLTDLAISDAIAPCQYLTQTQTATTITGVSGCGIQMISNFLRYKTPPHFRVYPNPTTGNVVVASSLAPVGDVEVKVSDVIGNIRTAKNFSSAKNMEIDLSLLPSGIYFVRIQSGGAVTVLPVALGK